MNDNLKKPLDALLTKAVKSGAAPGLVAMIGSRDSLLYAGCAGLRDIERGVAMSPDTVFWLASFTKLVTSIAALQLVERGQLSLDDPIDPILSAMADYRVITGFGPDDAPLLRVPKRAITLRHLLTHTSGLGYEFVDELLLRARGEAGPPPPTTLASLRGPLRFDPGEGWLYGTGIDWASLIVEAVSGQSLDRYFETEIFAPLGMTDTGFDVPTERRAQLYSRTGEADFDPAPSAVDDRSQWEYFPGGGGLFGTAGDYLRLLQALLNADPRLLAADMIRALFRVETGPHRAGVLPAVVPGLNAHFDLFPDMHTGWSLGGMVNPEPVPGGRYAGSLCWAGWANTYYWADPEAGICAVLMAQHLPFADPAMVATLHAFEAELYSCFNGREHQRR